MKSTLDTNVIIYAAVSESCAEKIDKTYSSNNFNIILRVVGQESRPKLVELSMFFSVLKDEIGKTRNPVKLIESDYYLLFKSKYPQIYKAIKNYIIKNKINNKRKSKELIRIVDFIINDIKYLVQLVSDEKSYYPLTEEEFEEIKKSKKFKECMDNLRDIIKNNDNDRVCLSLCNQYLRVNIKGDELSFCTIDKGDFIKHGNKDKIESLIKNLIIETLPELDVENITINK